MKSPKFVFPLVWILTTVLFAWGLGIRFFDYKHAFERNRPLVEITSSEMKSFITTSKAKLVLVHIWASWCEPCIREMPNFKLLQQKYSPDDVQFYLISADEMDDRPTASKFLKDTGIDFRTYVIGEDPAKFMQAIHPSWSGALPVTFLFKPGGALHSMILGESKLEQLEAKIALGVR